MNALICECGLSQLCIVYMVMVDRNIIIFRFLHLTRVRLCRITRLPRHNNLNIQKRTTKVIVISLFGVPCLIWCTNTRKPVSSRKEAPVGLWETQSYAAILENILIEDEVDCSVVNFHQICNPYSWRIYTYFLVGGNCLLIAESSKAYRLVSICLFIILQCRVIQTKYYV